jgi:uncharacterized protein (TIGR02444 family)
MSQEVWDGIVALYARPGVEAACMRLQDLHGLPVTALVFSLSQALAGHAVDSDAVVRVGIDIERDVTGPLRVARRALKAAPPWLDGADAKALRARIQAAELDAERLAIDAMCDLASAQDALPPLLAVRAVCVACGLHTEAVETDLQALVEVACAKL